MNIQSIYFAKVKSGAYVNLGHVKEINIWRDHCKRPEGSDDDKNRWRVLLIINPCDPYVWEQFETKEDAQDWLDITISRIINDG